MYHHLESIYNIAFKIHLCYNIKINYAHNLNILLYNGGCLVKKLTSLLLVMALFFNLCGLSVFATEKKICKEDSLEKRTETRKSLKEDYLEKRIMEEVIKFNGITDSEEVLIIKKSLKEQFKSLSYEEKGLGLKNAIELSKTTTRTMSKETQSLSSSRGDGMIKIVTMPQPFRFMIMADANGVTKLNGLFMGGASLKAIGATILRIAKYQLTPPTAILSVTIATAVSANLASMNYQIGCGQKLAFAVI